VSSISVMVVDDHLLVRAGLKSLLELPGDPAVTVEFTAEHGAEALKLLRTQRPDVVLMDIRMPVLDGIETLKAIRAETSTADLPVVILTTFDEDDLLFAALEAGASGFLRKDAEPTALREALTAAVRGDPVLDSRVTRRVIERAVSARGNDNTASVRLEHLTPREKELLACVGRGLTNDEIAGELFLSAATTRTYVSRLMTQLGCRDRVALVLLAHQAGLVSGA